MSTLRSASALLLGIFLVTCGVGLMNTLMAFRLEGQGHSAATIGWVQTGYFLGVVGGARHGHRIIRLAGHPRAFTAFVGLATTAALAHGLVERPEGLVGLRALIGFNVAGIYLVTESWLNELATPKTRAGLLGLYIAVSQVGFASGQLGFALGDPSGLQVFLLVGMVFALGGVPVALSRSHAPALSEIHSLRLRRLLRETPVGVIGCVFSGLLVGTIYGVGPVFAVRQGLDATQIARFMGAVMLGGATLPLAIGWLADRVDRTQITVAVALAIAALSGGLAAVPWSPSALVGLGFLLGGVVFVVYPLAVAQSDDYVDPPDRLAAAGALLLAYGIGSAMGPSLGGAAITLFGSTGAFGLLGVAAFGFAVFAAGARIVRPPLPADEQSEVVPVARTTVIAAELDPRVDVPDPAP